MNEMLQKVPANPVVTVGNPKRSAAQQAEPMRSWCLKVAKWQIERSSGFNIFDTKNILRFPSVTRILIFKIIKSLVLNLYNEK